MRSSSPELQTFGLFVSEDILSYLSDFTYEQAGVMNLDSYFDVNRGSVPKGDPFGELMTDVFEVLLDQFEWLYCNADFESVQEEVDPHSFQLVHIACEDNLVYEWKEWIEGVCVVEDCDLRTAHTAILRSAIDQGIFGDIETKYG